MPYIIETLYPWADEREPARRARARRAVATLDEACAAVTAAIRHLPRGTDIPADGYSVRNGCMGANGGTIGPLPDGTVIEVERATHRELFTAAGRHSLRALPGTQAIIDAYNAAQAS